MRSRRTPAARVTRTAQVRPRGVRALFEPLEQRTLMTISVTFSTYNLLGSFETATLASNGWVGVLIKAVSDANPVGGFDLDTGSRGITGNFAQVTASVLGNPTPTPTGTTPTSAAGSSVDIRDSYFSNFPGLSFSAIVALAENNNGSSHTTSTLQKTSGDYTFVPLADTSSNDYGIGNRLHGSGSFLANQTTTVAIAFVVVPAGSTVHVVGQFADIAPSSHSFLVDQSFVPPAAPNTVASRSIFYNNSAYDGNNATANSSDDLAVAIDKTPLMPGGAASFANYTSYSKGINGIMVDMTSLTGTLTASDFTFKVGGSAPGTSDPAGWATGPNPTVIAARPVAGFGSSTRVELIWADNAIQNQWLQVVVKATANTGLTAATAFYFGNTIGESGNSATDTRISGVDEIGARAFAADLTGLSTAAAIVNVYDYNRDKHVDAGDEAVAGGHYTNFTNALLLISAPASPAVVPLSESAGTINVPSTVDQSASTTIELPLAGTPENQPVRVIKRPRRPRFSGLKSLGWSYFLRG